MFLGISGVDIVTMGLDIDPRAPFSAAEVLSLIRRTSARSDDPFHAFHACLNRTDEANPSFAAISYQENSLSWDAFTHRGRMTLVANWKAIHGCSDWSCTGQQQTRVELRYIPHLNELVLTATVTPQLPSTHEEF